MYTEERACKSPFRENIACARFREKKYNAKGEFYGKNKTFFSSENIHIRSYFGNRYCLQRM
ncbi:MAG: hypothetical protein II110_09140, partial [Treponema sp.]|nr:hypothetical protein [Treponema sp.]